MGKISMIASVLDTLGVLNHIPIPVTVILPLPPSQLEMNVALSFAWYLVFQAAETSLRFRGMIQGLFLSFL